jgi:hypothetical protein
MNASRSPGRTQVQPGPDQVMGAAQQALDAAATKLGDHWDSCATCTAAEACAVREPLLVAYYAAEEAWSAAYRLVCAQRKPARRAA